jgi:putative molybdopterin biosynthesis protein
MTPAPDRPAPPAAYARWLDALARAGWSAWPASGPPGDPDRVPVGEALGRVTAAPVTARWPSPREDCAAMDGIAVRAADLAAGGTVRLAPGQFAWIDTGDPMPAGPDTVVVRERLLRQADGGVLVTPDARGRAEVPGRNVRAAGEDFTAGEALVPAGRRLRPGDLAAVAAGGHVAVAVAREPAVAIIPTGDEVRPLGSRPRRGDIIDTNSLMLAARCRQLGAAPAVSPVIPDDPDALAAELRRAAARADLVLVIAGSSRGRDDHTGVVLAQVGGVAVAGVAVRPGHPALLGHAKRPEAAPGQRSGIAPVIGLPGYPLAAAVVFELFAAPLLGELTGPPAVSDRARARLDRTWNAHAGAEDWVLVTLGPAGPGGLPAASPARRGASSVSQLARADGWWRVPAGPATFAAGTEIDVILIR